MVLFRYNFHKCTSFNTYLRSQQARTHADTHKHICPRTHTLTHTHIHNVCKCYAMSYLQKKLH